MLLGPLVAIWAALLIVSDPTRDYSGIWRFVFSVPFKSAAEISVSYFRTEWSPAAAG
jgi:hypothetical protein